MAHELRTSPNAPLIGAAGSRARLQTPALLLDLDALERNLALMSRFCSQRGLTLRPHVKTHKSVRIARRQIEAGAVGVCVATLREAAVMLDSGLPGIHLTTPVAGTPRLEGLAALLKRGNLSVVVDSLESLLELRQTVATTGRKVTVLVDVDLGAMYRTGVQDIESAVSLARELSRSEVLEYGGVQFYSGIVQHVPTRAERMSVYGTQLERLRSLLSALEAEGLKPRIVSGGGTGTLHLDAELRLLTENQAGSYALMDVEYGAVELLEGGGGSFEPALFVQSSVVSNRARGLVTLDAGSKSLATDGPSPSVHSGAPRDFVYQTFGDEFGMLLAPQSAAHLERVAAEWPAEQRRSFGLFEAAFSSCPGSRQLLDLGTKVELLAPHCDPTVNLHDFYHCVRGDVLVDIWPVDARASL
ncbi:MAG: alanine racemase [Proteobacteria bacterium]|nr:alanine racemase [Pseudomonadota bacterium]